MEQQNPVTANWDASNAGSAKRLYGITDDGGLSSFIGIISGFCQKYSVK
ncbi:hypothetical protein [Desulfofarcimen acetoxidans]